jgi:ATP-binding cassette subfamily C protein
VLGVAYLGIYFAVEDILDKVGEERVNTNTARYQSVSEAFGGIKEVKLRGKEEVFLEQYRVPSKRYARVQALYRIISKAPKYILEAIAFGGIILIAIYLIAARENFQQVIPMLGLYSFAGYRLMPALQKAFRGLTSARFNLAALMELRQDMERKEQSKINDVRSYEKKCEEVKLKKSIVLDGVCFAYPNAEEPAVENVSLEIPARSMVGFVGQTGSGKTTMVDLILGLFEPQEGRVVVDGVPIRKHNVDQWQENIGYVPQQIFLSDDTVARNIAFGVPEDEININAVKDAARRAHIYDFVEGQLPDQWDTMVGELGVKLSGGQRQRIGIARALYHQPPILVFDEATSALDQATEASVMEAIYELEEDHTLLLIAHRLITVRRADKIIMLEGGRKVGEGEYDELVQRHSKFRSMAFS